jgi:hypothetical protein
MQQQINLYRYLPHPIRSFLDLKMITILSSGFLGILMLFYLFGLIHEQILASRLTKLSITLENSRQHLQQIAAKFPELDIAQRAMTASKIAACKTKFSPLLEGFANAITPGIWLTNFTISNNGHLISVKGYTTRAIDAQEFLEKLNKDVTFATTPFVMQDLAQPIETTPAKPTAPTNALSFSLLAGVSQ